MTVRDAGLRQGWDLQGSPDATENLYANLATCAGETVSCIDNHLFDGLGDLGSLSPSHFVLTTDEEENPFGHAMYLGWAFGLLVGS